MKQLAIARTILGAHTSYPLNEMAPSRCEPTRGRVVRGDKGTNLTAPSMHKSGQQSKGLMPMEPVVPFRRFKIPQVINTQFFKSTSTNNNEFMAADLAASGLDIEDIQAYTHPMLPLPEKALAGYVIPYHDVEGNPLVDAENNLIMFRTKLKIPEYSKDRKYTQPTAEQLAKHGLPSVMPYILPKTLELQNDYLICCEGEKKTASVIKYLGLPAFGIGGAQMWRDPSGSGGTHPWIRRLLDSKGVKRILIIPDGDVLRYDICTAYGTFAAALRNEGYTVELLNPTGKIDDLILTWPKGDLLANFESIPRLDSEALVQSPGSLTKRYNLAFKQDGKDKVIVHQHTSNVMILMEEHNAFPKFWRNLDNNRVMVGDVPAQPDLTEMELANYFQHNLGFDKVNHRMLYSCIQAIAKRNAHSPMLTYIRGLEWDGEPRLATWLHRLWGVPLTPFSQEVAIKWLVSACARMDKPGTKIDWIMIVVGPQGTGKTSMPGILFKDNAITLYGDHNDKDLHMLLHSALVVGFDELDSFSKRESSNLKAMITRNEDAFRPPYGASVEIFPRRFTLYGCGNRYEFLQSDPSGHRRYAVVEVDRLLDFAGLEAERDQLWAEAWATYQKGIKYWEVERASEEAQKHVIPDVMEDKIESLLDRMKDDKMKVSVVDGVVYFTLSEVLRELDMEKANGNSYQVRELAATLRKLGAVKPDKTSIHPITKVRGKYYTLKM